MNNHQNAIFHQITNFLKTPLALLGVDLKNFQFNKICHFANHPYLCKGLQTYIEGSKLTDSEIETLLGEVKNQSFSHRDEQEVAGYSEVMETIFANFEYIKISENYIKQLHIILLKHSDKDTRHRGEYKKHTNNVEAFDELGKSLSVVYITPKPQTTF